MTNDSNKKNNHAVVAQLVEHFHGKEEVTGSIPVYGSTPVKSLHGITGFMGGYRSGQTGQTVNLLAYAFQGSNPCPPTTQEALAKASVFCLVEPRFVP